MINFSKRSYQKELLDAQSISINDTMQTMKELDIINTYLGGHAITLNGFKKLLGKKKKTSICEIGCGGGDNLNVIGKWCKKKGINIKLIGVDINPNCSNVIERTNPEIEFLGSDYKKIDFDKNVPDILFSSLFCHHFTDEELIEMVMWMKTNSTRGFFINDLHRHPLAYHSIKLITKLFSNSHLVKNDGPLSVLRSFKKADWINILQQAGITNYTIQWKWAFRYLIVVYND